MDSKKMKEFEERFGELLSDKEMAELQAKFMNEMRDPLEKARDALLALAAAGAVTLMGYVGLSTPQQAELSQKACEALMLQVSEPKTEN